MIGPSIPEHLRRRKEGEDHTVEPVDAPLQAPTSKKLGPQLPPHLKRKENVDEVDDYETPDQDASQARDSSDDDDAIGPSLKVRKTGDANEVE